MIIVLLILLMCAGLLLFRVFRGPEIQDRIIAADAFSVILSLAIIVLAFAMKDSFLYDLCLVYALLAFVNVLIMAKFFEHGGLHK